MTKIAQAPDHHRSSKTKELQIAFLICDEPAEKTLKEHGGMDDLLNHLLQPILKTADPDIELVVEGYDVVNKREYPSQAALRDIDCVMISGSFVEDAHVDTPWISRLAGYVIYLHDVWPSIRIIGICFGHQVIARAFGSRVEKNEQGWEIGSTLLKLTDEGSSLIGTPGKPESELWIQQIHSDHVTSVPEGFSLLASSKKCHVQSLVKYYDDEIPGFTHGSKLPPEPYRSVHIITLQGHCEWDGQHVILPLVDEFLEEGKITQELADEAKKNALQPDDAEVFGRCLLRVMGVAREETHKIGEEHGTA